MCRRSRYRHGAGNGDAETEKKTDRRLCTITGTMSIESGTSLGQYRVERLLGQGGMGRVYRAFDTRLERPVAIKLLQPTPDQQAGRRLLQEARTASALNHPNICTVHEVAEHGDNSFIV